MLDNPGQCSERIVGSKLEMPCRGIVKNWYLYTRSWRRHSFCSVNCSVWKNLAVLIKSCQTRRMIIQNSWIREVWHFQDVLVSIRSVKRLIGARHSGPIWLHSEQATSKSNYIDFGPVAVTKFVGTTVALSIVTGRRVCVAGNRGIAERRWSDDLVAYMYKYMSKRKCLNFFDTMLKQL